MLPDGPYQPQTPKVSKEDRSITPLTLDTCLANRIAAERGEMVVFFGGVIAGILVAVPSSGKTPAERERCGFRTVAGRATIT
jgi:hypothetical protein